MRRWIYRTLAVAVALLLIGAEDQVIEDDVTPEDDGPPMLERITVKRPPGHVKIRHDRFVPWGKPSEAQVKRIIRVESNRWGAPAWRLRCRIEGESGFRWYAENGQYKGLGQFAYSTFTRGLSSIKTRRVRMVVRKTRTRRERVTYHYDDGSKKRQKGAEVEQRVRHVYRGRIPKPTTWLHGWAQVRIMAQAMVGRSAVNDSEWSVRCAF